MIITFYIFSCKIDYMHKIDHIWLQKLSKNSSLCEITWFTSQYWFTRTYLNSYIPLCDCPHVESNCWNHVFIELSRLRQSTITLCVILIRKFAQNSLSDCQQPSFSGCRPPDLELFARARHHDSNTPVLQETLENVLTATIVLTSTLVVLEVTSVT